MSQTDWAARQDETDKLTDFYYGLVIDNRDPENSARVRVQIPGLLDLSDWAEPAAIPGGGSAGELQRGLYTTPPLDAKVIVGFIQGDINTPFYFTAGFPRKARTNEPNSPIRGFVGPPDRELDTINDTPGAIPFDLEGAEGPEVLRLAFGRWELVIDTRDDNADAVGGGDTLEATGTLRIRDHLIADWSSTLISEGVDIFEAGDYVRNLEIVFDRANSSIDIRAPYQINIESGAEINLNAPLVTVNNRKFKSTTKPI